MSCMKKRDLKYKDPKVYIKVVEKEWPTKTKLA